MSAPVSVDAPFVAPREPTAAAAIDEIREELALFDDDDSYYDYIIDEGRKLPPMPVAWQDEAHRLTGCLARVWLHHDVADGVMRFAGSSDATIVSGLVSLVLRVYSGRSAPEIVATNPSFLTELGLIRSLTSNRSNGVDSMARAIQSAARAAA